MHNFIPDQNRFKLSGPPEWWLRLLHDFDDSLYVIPSRQGFYYRLAQKRKLNLPENMVNDILFKESDTQMLASYSLVPVTTILATANWNPLMFKELEERAPWRMGGADKVNQRLEDLEWEQHKKKLQQTDQMLTDRAREGWRSYQWKTGQRTSVKRERPRQKEHAVIPPGFTQTSAGVIVPS